MINYLINIEASIKTFVDMNYVKKYKLSTISLIKLCKLRLIDDKLKSNVIYIIRLQFTLKDHIEKL